MNQQNDHNQAVIPRRSRRLATFIPASHWIAIGYSNEVAQLTEKLQNDMKKYCDGSGHTVVELRGRRVNNLPLPYHDMMLPHWQKLFKAIQGRSNVDTIYIIDICMPISVLDMIFSAVQLQKLQLIGVNLGNEGLLRVVAFLEDHSSASLHRLALGWDAIDESVATPLADALKNHPTLERIGFAKCELNNVAVLKIMLEGCKTKKNLAI